MFKRVSLNWELAFCVRRLFLYQRKQSGVSIDDSSPRRSKKGVYIVAPTGKLAKSLNTFEPNAKCSEEERIETIKISKMGLGYVFFWRNRDKVLVQGPVARARKGEMLRYSKSAFQVGGQPRS